MFETKKDKIIADLEGMLKIEKEANLGMAQKLAKATAELDEVSRSRDELRKREAAVENEHEEQAKNRALVIEQNNEIENLKRIAQQKNSEIVRRNKTTERLYKKCKKLEGKGD